MSSSNDRPLPSGWSSGFSKSKQKPYFICGATNHTQWHFPTDDDVADPKGAKHRVEETMRAELAKRSASSGGGGPSQKRPKSSDAASVAIIVPYRDLHAAQNRARHLRQFVPHMLQFLKKLKRRGLVSDYHVYIVEQSDDGRKFNRGKLLNIGFDLARRDRRLGHNVFIFHDVDLLPGDDLGEWYAKFPQKPLHIARVWGRYSNNPKYFGGIVSFSAADMRKINGYPNTFWGWGGEDDEMQKRCEKTNMKWESPPRVRLNPSD
uniref:WW domain-containing protein n=1 Tax=Odontella aurita TaxID=265563 RepID=A0A7S4M9S3_9STRA